MAKTTLDRIRERARGSTVLNAPMTEHTTLRVGGPADLLVCPADREDLAGLLSLLAEGGVPHFVLGNGSNLIVRDGGIRGALIQLTEGFRELEVQDEEEDRVVFRCEAGQSLRLLVRWCVDHGVGGFETLAAIPGTLGGAVAMNAGAWGAEIGERVLELEVADPEGGIRVLPREELRFSYRTLDLPRGHTVLSALLEGPRRDPGQLKTQVRDLHRRRRESQPTQQPSAGSVFRNPPGKSAGQLIEDCGLKGVRVGDAEVSRMHANFIVNLGSATAGQVVALMGMIQERVFVKHGVKLEPEVRIVGAWDKGKLRISE